MDIELNYKKYIRYLQAYIQRDGIENLITWLDKKSDIKTAPASTKYHLSCEGGLIQHSLNVFIRLIHLLEQEYPRIFVGNDEEGKEIWEETCPYSKETIAIAALLHDISKVNYYKKIFKNVQNQETGIWERVSSYAVRDEEDRINYATHEENSVYMISQFIKLSYEEMLAIRYHMGTLNSTEEFAQNHMISAYKHSPLALLLHTADMMAMCIDEVERPAEEEREQKTEEPKADVKEEKNEQDIKETTGNTDEEVPF